MFEREDGQEHPKPSTLSLNPMHLSGTVGLFGKVRHGEGAASAAGGSRYTLYNPQEPMFMNLTQCFLEHDVKQARAHKTVRRPQAGLGFWALGVYL